MIDQNSQFYAILTNVGVAKQANADVLGIPWKITQMGVGDANGTDPQPSAAQTSLINEWRRAPLNQLKQDDNNPAIIIAEQVIPADIGGKWIREIGLYDADGDLVAVANCAPSFKPLLTQGSGRTQVVRMNLIVSNSANVELKIDPSVVLATREFVMSELAKLDFKSSVFACAPGSIVLSGLQTVDGVVVPAGKRVLAPFQTAAKDRGIWIAAAGAWTRSTDADISDEVTPGMLVLVEQGTLYGDSAWQLVTDATITLGVTSLTFEMAWGRTGIVPGEYRSVVVDKLGRVVSASNPTTVAGYGLTDVYTKAQVDTLLAAKAPLASPVLTGIPKAPTAAPSTSTDQIATTAFVQALFTALVGAAPGTLDQINEIAAALGNDPNFATTIMNSLALKAPLASPVLTGDPRAPTPVLGDNDTSIATTAFVQAAMAAFGLGVTTMAYMSNMDDPTLANGWYSVGSTTAGTKPQFETYGVLVVNGRNNLNTTQGRISQTFYRTDGTVWAAYGRVWITGSAWSTWQTIATLDSPVFTGDPRAPTPALGDNDTSIATTAFVQAALAAFGLGTANAPQTADLDALTASGFYYAGSAANGLPVAANSSVLHFPWNGLSAAVQIACTLAAPTKIFWRTKSSSSWTGWKEFSMLDSPVFTGDPRAPTQLVGDNDTSVATTAFVQAALAAFGIGANTSLSVSDLNLVVLGGIYRASSPTNAPVGGSLSILVLPFNSGGCLQIAALLGGVGQVFWRIQAGGSWQPWQQFGGLDSPTFTGKPKAPTAAAGDASQQIVNTQFLKDELARTKTVLRWTAGTTWTCPDGVTQGWLSGCGGGGGGGAGAGYTSAGAGGGGGGAAGQSAVQVLVTLVPGTVYTITIGAGGAAAPTAAAGVAGGQGGAGGQTKFSTLLTLNGGGQGLGGDIVAGAGGFGSATGGGGGNDGGDGKGAGGDGGGGGGGPFGTAGGGGRGGTGAGDSARAGSGFGTGGGGGGGGYSSGATGGAGGAGMPGLLILEI